MDFSNDGRELTRYSFTRAIATRHSRAINGRTKGGPPTLSTCIPLLCCRRVAAHRPIVEASACLHSALCAVRGTLLFASRPLTLSVYTTRIPNAQKAPLPRDGLGGLTRHCAAYPGPNEAVIAYSENKLPPLARRGGCTGMGLGCVVVSNNRPRLRALGP
jgi:hypothetical protein